MKKELLKQQIRRNFIFWGKLAEKYVGCVMGMVVGYVFIFSCLGRGEIFGNGEIWSVFFVYQILLFLSSSLIIPMSYGITYISLAVSFGSKREEAVWGFQWMNWLVLGQLGGLLLLFAKFSSTIAVTPLIVWFTLFGGMFGFALGQIITVLGFRYGMKIVWIALAALMALIVLLGGIVFAFIVQNGIFLINRYWMTAGAAAAVILYLGSIILLLRVVRIYEIRI